MLRFTSLRALVMCVHTLWKTTRMYTQEKTSTTALTSALSYNHNHTSPTKQSTTNPQLLLTNPTAKIENDRKRKKVSSSTPVSSSDRRARKKTAMSSNQVNASHILIKHQGSRRKASWKDPEGKIICETTKESAISQLLSLKDEIVAGKVSFDDVAKHYSDCSSAKRGGDLGRFGRGQMQKPFEEATYALKVGEMSDVVDTDSGVHIIMRTG